MSNNTKKLITSPEYKHKEKSAKIEVTEKPQK